MSDFLWLLKIVLFWSSLHTYLYFHMWVISFHSFPSACQKFKNVAHFPVLLHLEVASLDRHFA